MNYILSIKFNEEKKSRFSLLFFVTTYIMLFLLLLLFLFDNSVMSVFTDIQQAEHIVFRSSEYKEVMS